MRACVRVKEEVTRERGRGVLFGVFSLHCQMLQKVHLHLLLLTLLLTR